MTFYKFVSVRPSPLESLWEGLESNNLFRGMNELAQFSIFYLTHPERRPDLFPNQTKYVPKIISFATTHDATQPHFSSILQLCALLAQSLFNPKQTLEEIHCLPVQVTLEKLGDVKGALGHEGSLTSLLRMDTKGISHLIATCTNFPQKFAECLSEKNMLVSAGIPPEDCGIRESLTTLDVSVNDSDPLYFLNVFVSLIDEASTKPHDTMPSPLQLLHTTLGGSGEAQNPQKVLRALIAVSKYYIEHDSERAFLQPFAETLRPLILEFTHRSFTGAHVIFAGPLRIMGNMVQLLFDTHYSREQVMGIPLNIASQEIPSHTTFLGRALTTHMHVSPTHDSLTPQYITDLILHNASWLLLNVTDFREKFQLCVEANKDTLKHLPALIPALQLSFVIKGNTNPTTLDFLNACEEITPISLRVVIHREPSDLTESSTQVSKRPRLFSSSSDEENPHLPMYVDADFREDFSIFRERLMTLFVDSTERTSLTVAFSNTANRKNVWPEYTKWKDGLRKPFQFLSDKNEEYFLRASSDLIKEFFRIEDPDFIGETLTEFPAVLASGYVSEAAKDPERGQLFAKRLYAFINLLLDELYCLANPAVTNCILFDLSIILKNRAEEEELPPIPSDKEIKMSESLSKVLQQLYDSSSKQTKFDHSFFSAICTLRRNLMGGQYPIYIEEITLNPRTWWDVRSVNVSDTDIISKTEIIFLKNKWEQPDMGVRHHIPEKYLSLIPENIIEILEALPDNSQTMDEFVHILSLLHEILALQWVESHDLQEVFLLTLVLITSKCTEEAKNKVRSHFTELALSEETHSYYNDLVSRVLWTDATSSDLRPKTLSGKHTLRVAVPAPLRIPVITFNFSREPGATMSDALHLAPLDVSPDPALEAPNPLHTGILNEGNYCFAISVLAMLGERTILNGLLQSDPSQMSPDQFRAQQLLILILHAQITGDPRHLLRHCADPEKNHPLDHLLVNAMKELVAMVSHVTGTPFSNGMQHCAQEFILGLSTLTTLPFRLDLVSRLHGKAHTEEGRAMSPNPYPDFADKPSADSIIPLPLTEGVASIQTGLDAFFANERLIPGERYKIEISNKVYSNYVYTERQFCLGNTPHVLLVSVRDRHLGQAQRARISIDNYVSITLINGTRQWFKLISWNHHQGSQNGGHYTATCLLPNGNGNRINNEVSTLSEQPFSRQNPYLLMYYPCNEPV